MLRLTLAILFATTPAFAERPIDYVRDVRPLLQERCFACHGSLKQNGKLRLDGGANLLKGGKSGPAIVARNPGESPLLKRVSEADEHARMPPEGLPLTADQIRTLTAWIDQGAIFPATDVAELDPREHWSFRPPTRPAVPKLEPTYGRNSVDAFLADAWRKVNVTPAAPADRRLLLRRVHLDLTGLPPTAEEIDAFLADTAPDAYEKVVNRLLDSPQYGERWGRHLMDLWRYSDWWGLGAEVRNSQKHVWHWRDWIVESLNADRGYDRMVREMLAADEIAPTDTQALRATGYLVRPYFIFNRTTWLDETVEHVSKGFLGLTVNCAKCHDHKYDPIAANDYYRLRAFFEPYQVRTDMLAGESDFEKAGLPRVFDCNLTAVTFKHERGDERRPVKGLTINPGLPGVLGGDLKIEPVTLPDVGHAPHLRPWVEENYRKQVLAQIAVARSAVDKARTELAAIEKKLKDAPVVKSEPAKSLFKDDFAKERPELWDIGLGDWKYADGKLRQSNPGAVDGRIRAKVEVPTDFEATARFTITGGDPWKSVGIRFDVAGTHDVLVYVSATAGGPKLQIAYKQGGNYAYPADGAVARPIKVNEPIELSIRVRGPVVNVALDGDQQLAYRLPIPRAKGAIELITYAATAEFNRFEVATLPSSIKLAEPAGSKSAAGSIEQARAALVVAEKTLAVAESQPGLLAARFAAERAKFAEPKAANAVELAKAAAKAEKLAAIASADEALARAELELIQAATAQRALVEKKRDTAKATLAAAKKAAESPGDSYTAPRGSSKAKESNLETDESLRKPYPTTSTGRRTALANWIADKKNPLTARVMVNHVWARHFGRPLVATVFDFGRKGAKPSHPELLDWLAVEFMESGWSYKHLHRLLVTSEAYRMGSSSDSTIDPENRLFARRNPMRMEAQAVRDSLLHLAGKLDRTMGGPSIPVDADVPRRSLYFVHSHNDHNKFLMQFDDAGVLECYRRTESIVPQQALTLSNSKFSLAMSEAIAARLQAKFAMASDETFVSVAFEWLLGSSSTADERAACLEALAEWKKQVPAAKARSNLIAALVNHNDFVTVR